MLLLLRKYIFDNEWLRVVSSRVSIEKEYKPSLRKLPEVIEMIKECRIKNYIKKYC